MQKEDAIVSADGAAIRAAMLEEIRRELATMTERERMQLLLELREVFGQEQKDKLGVKV